MAGRACEVGHRLEHEARQIQRSGDTQSRVEEADDLVYHALGRLVVWIYDAPKSSNLDNRTFCFGAIQC